MSELTYIPFPESEKLKLKQLINQFRNNIAQYKGPNYDEANTRTDFIDKFFGLLGWDISNEKGLPEQHREVIREDKLLTGHWPKYPDYSFRLGKERVFFVEAKRPSIDIKHSVHDAFQIRSYGYTAKLALSILTDFEEFAIYDTRIKPHENDSPLVGRIFYCKYNELFEKSKEKGFETNIDYIYSTFSLKAVWHGSIDHYAESKKNGRGYNEVDQDLLALVEKWRLNLAKSLAKANCNLDVYNLNIAVQRIIDRILFLRIAEDRRIEQYENLLRAAEKKDVYKNLYSLFLDADDKYNAGLFKQETWLNELNVDDKILTTIIKGLYPPKCPYAFSVLPIEILGSIYEQFLGKTIRLTAGHQAKIEEKSNIRKAGGVYYTPQNIVDYIVQETIGKKIEGKKPKAIEKFRFLDPACGSGSFLVGAYTFLLDWHQSYYEKKQNCQDALRTGKIYQISEHTYRLSIEEKQRILLKNIYGVDLDPLAVEVTKLSLYLKLLENETIEERNMLFSTKLLPNLDKNIQCGNSLIEEDFFKDKPPGSLNLESMRLINAFDWQAAFPDIIQKGGFDCVIGNPPWGQKATKFSQKEKDYFLTKYPSASSGILDLFRFFVEKSINLLAPNGIWGQVLPDIILLKNYETTRRLLLDTMTLCKISHWGKAFQQVNLEACTIIAEKVQNKNGRKVEIAIHRKDHSVSTREIEQSVFSNLPGCKFNLHLTDSAWKVLKKLSKNVVFRQFFEVHEGIHSGNAREKLFVDKKINSKCRKLIFGRDEIKRYSLKWNGKWVHYTKDHFDIQDYAGLGKPEYFECPKLIIRRTGDYVLACIDDEGYYFSNNVFVCVPSANEVDMKFFLGILNSRLLTWYYQTMQPRVGKMFAEIKINLINDFPMPFDKNGPIFKKTQAEKLVSLVDLMYEALTARQEAISSADRKSHDQTVTILDREIDRLVYDLYGLSENDIQTIETERN